MNRSFLIIIFFLNIGSTNAQSKVRSVHPINVAKSPSSSPVQMPYNRLIQSAGKVITYGNPELENHALDVTALPDKKSVVVEDRYGVAMIDVKTNVIVNRWSFSDSVAYKNLVSTYSGIISFVYQNKTYLVWSAQDGKSDKGFVVLAELKRAAINTISLIQFNAIATAKVAIPNQVVYQC